MFHKLTSIEPKSDYMLLSTFESGEKRLYDVKSLFSKWAMFLPIKDETLFRSVKLAPGGYAAVWNSDIDIACDELYFNGIAVEDENKLR